MKKTANGKFPYEEVTESLRRKIIAGEFKAGGALPPEPDLAETFKVNRTTIRKALSILQREGRIIRQHGRGTFVLDRRDKTRTILYIGSMHTHGHSEQFAALHAAAIEKGWRLLGLDLRFYKERNAAILKEYLGEVESVIINDGYYPMAADELAASHHRLIVIGLVPPAIGRPAVYILNDYGRATRLAVDYLASLGHRRIALATMGDGGVAPGQKEYERTVYNEVYTSYRVGLALNGIKDGSQSVLLRIQSGYEKEDRKNLLKLLIRKNAPTAFICESDFRANMLYQAAAELNLNIPGDFSVIGMDNSPWCTTWIPRLTSVGFCREETAELAVHYCAGHPPSGKVICRFEPQLVARQSCAPPSRMKEK